MDATVGCKLIDAAFRRACSRLGRTDLLVEGTFASSEDFLEREIGCKPEQYDLDRDEAPVGVTFFLDRPSSDYVELGRIEHDVDGLALRCRWVNFCDIKHGDSHVAIANSGGTSTGDIQAVIREMLKEPELEQLESAIFDPMLARAPVLSRVVDIVSDVLTQSRPKALRDCVYHDWNDGKDFGSHDVGVIPIKLQMFELIRYPRVDALDGRAVEYFDDHSSGPVQLTFWVMPSSDGCALEMACARPQYGWYRSPFWLECSSTEFENVVVSDLHETHRKYFRPKDLDRTREILMRWEKLAKWLRDELGAPNFRFHDAMSFGSHLFTSISGRREVIAAAEPARIEVCSTSSRDRFAQRVRSEPPPCSSVHPLVTPVVAFGNWETAEVATLGLNPSIAEFLDRSGRELHGRDRRLETRSSLGAPRFDQMSDAEVSVVLDSCRTYFLRRPYRRWFDVLEGVLRKIDVSYYDGSACHLDLSPWATDPKWGNLPPEVRERLIQDGKHFLLEQLRMGAIHMLLLNGSSVIAAFQAATQMPLYVKDEELVDGALRASFVGGWYNDVAVIGWSVNLQSSYGVTTQFRQAVADRVWRLRGGFFR